MYNVGMDTTPVIDIISRQTTYFHFSLPNATTLIYDVSGCRFVACAPNPDKTLTVVKDGQEIQIKPIQPKP